MSSLFLVRHGQASLHADDYDDLSAVGGQQSRRLGEVLSQRAIELDAVYVGPHRRHQQTLDGIIEADHAWPEPEQIEGLAELNAASLGQQAMERVLPSCPDLRERLKRGDNDSATKTALRHYNGIFESLMKRWTQGEFEQELGSFVEFSQGVMRALSGIMQAQGRGKRALVVTSGGPISVATGIALGLAPDKTMELLFALNNASITELRFTENRLTLIRFNDAGHLPAELLTGI